MKHMHTVIGKESSSNGFEGQFKVTAYVVSLWEICSILEVAGPRSFLSLFYSLLSVQQCIILAKTKQKQNKKQQQQQQNLKFSKIIQISESTNSYVKQGPSECNSKGEHLFKCGQ